MNAGKFSCPACDDNIAALRDELAKAYAAVRDMACELQETWDCYGYQDVASGSFSATDPTCMKHAEVIQRAEEWK